MDHLIAGPTGTETATETRDDLGRVLVTATLEPGQRLRIVKLLAYGWSSTRSIEALGDQVSAALAEARHSGWDGLLSPQRDYLDDFWEHSDVEVHGDLAAPAGRALWHVSRPAGRREGRAARDPGEGPDRPRL